ncbi:MAG: TSCPD domain-containing protein [Bacteroidales bacterium]|nr:TSCPD domain-containing protein [Candidatus Scybalousia scybalohippi]
MTVEQWLNNDQLGIDIWNKKYRYNNETLDEWFDRVSGGNPYIRQLIVEKKFLFAGRTLANRGTNLGSYNNCATIGRVEDSLNGIMKTASDIAKAFKASSGEGLSLSDIRPKGAKIKDYFESDGIVPFMEIFNTVTASISQGSHRRGALLMSLDAKHPQIKDFITIKSDLQKINNANLSVEVDDEFMSAVEQFYKTGEKITLHIKSPYKGYPDYDIVPIDIYKLMMEQAYNYAEPGVLFMNRFKNYNIMEQVADYQIVSCNPCSEKSMAPHETCALCSFNVSEYVLNPFTVDAKIDIERFNKDLYAVVEAMDELIDENMNNHPLPEQKVMAEKFRNIGIGLMGVYDMLLKLRIRYGSDEAIKFMDDFMFNMFRQSVKASSTMAVAKSSFPGYEDCVFDSEIIRNHFSEEEIAILKSQGLRNCSLISIAPTGSLASMLSCSYSTEVLFAKSYKRKTVSLNEDKETVYEVYPKIVQEYLNRGGWINDTILDTAYSVDPYQRVKFQKAIQDHTDSACSVTFNLKEDVSLEYIEQLYLAGWKAGLKGLTIFREGSRPAILDASTKKEEPKTEPLTRSFDFISPISRKDLGTTSGTTACKKCACGTLYITCNHDSEGNLVEVFTHTSKGGICQANMNAVTRLVSLNLRSGVKVDEIIDQLKGINCPACSMCKAKGINIDGLSCPDIISKTIQEAMKYVPCNTPPIVSDAQNSQKTTNISMVKKCPECGEPLIASGGCYACTNCGYSKCE